MQSASIMPTSSFSPFGADLPHVWRDDFLGKHGDVSSFNRNVSGVTFANSEVLK
jgi:hypothetical protein